MWALEKEEITEFIFHNETPDAKAWLAEVMKGLKHEDLTRVVVRLWAIWYARRQALHENQFQSPFSTNSFVERFINELDSVKPKNKKMPMAVSPAPRWIKPPRGFQKINVDAAISKNLSKASVAAVARDEDGNFLGASALVLEGCTDAEIAEVVACREGLALASDLGIQIFRVASDCSNAVRSIHGQGFGTHGPIIQEIKTRKAGFTRVEFVHEGRSSNCDAHCLARSCVNFVVGRHVWFVSPPDGVCTSYTDI